MKKFIMLCAVVSVLVAAPSFSHAEPSPNAPPSPQEFGLLRAWMATHGWSQAQIDSCVGTNVGGRDRVVIADSLKACIRALPQSP